ncbi:MAG: (2Fe-2S)-binding protein [Bdellovibrionales bacterium]|nr:(2Fe-2S)-binding protein [Bdellovibrionales bacterium]MBT3526773.1 (2Fe-2S)-binding protein [Bdellovibrionales bacterium]
MNKKQHTLLIDGNRIEIYPEDRNIIEVAAHHRVGIPSPCYKANQSKGCCNGCIIEIAGEHQFACSTHPEDGMVIIFNRDDLKALRKKRLKKYQEGIKTGSNPRQCSIDG